MGHVRGKQNGTTKIPVQYQTGKKIGQTYMKTVPTYDRAPEQLDRGTVFSILEPLFASPVIEKGGHDSIYDLCGVSKYLGFVPSPPYNCSKIGRWLLNENSRRGTWLKEIIEDTYGVVYDEENIGKCVEDFEFDKVAYYSYCDAKWDFLIMQDTLAKIATEGLRSVYELEMNVLNTLIGMRLTGVKIDVPKIEELREQLKEDLVKAEAKIYSVAGRKFNVNSPQQKSEILFKPKSAGGQGLKPWKLTKVGKDRKELGLSLEYKHYSTDDEVLSSYPQNEICSSLREYGDIDKVLGTYVESWLGKDDEVPKIVDQRIYAGFLQYGTVTGRFSCRAPNLQNLPRSSSTLGKAVRDCFIAESGGKLIVADYSQIELVILAHYIGEGKLYEAFQMGIDPHTMTAAMVLGKDPADVTKIERQDLGKTLGFAVVYGAGLGKVSSMAKISLDEAKRVLKTHEKMFPEIHQFKADVISLADSRQPVPYIRTLLNRKRRVPELNSSVVKVRMGAERQVFNSLIQGGAADIIKLAMVRLDASLPNEAKLVLTVHDELAVTSPNNMMDETMKIMDNAMRGPGIQKFVRVPLKIDMHAGHSWGEVK